MTLLDFDTDLHPRSDLSGRFEEKTQTPPELALAASASASASTYKPGEIVALGLAELLTFESTDSDSATATLLTRMWWMQKLPLSTTGCNSARGGQAGSSTRSEISITLRNSSGPSKTEGSGSRRRCSSTRGSPSRSFTKGITASPRRLTWGGGNLCAVRRRP